MAQVPINHPVSADSNQFNPWHLLSQIAVEEDFVVVKLDIGTSANSVHAKVS